MANIVKEKLDSVSDEEKKMILKSLDEFRKKYMEKQKVYKSRLSDIKEKKKILNRAKAKAARKARKANRKK